jgi:hypothetical protein
MKKETYTESKGLNSFDWNVALQGRKTKKQWVELEDRASDWITCACGNLCSVIPRRCGGEPLDFPLKDLGLRFYQDILKHRSIDAKKTLRNIEFRSAYLIEKMKNEK